mmetsp:Transcript_32039/g.106059  ORF Transcript_32039/g.106059 Transcript_32039/m.106059 type:complete len:163 (+) Transcript_32039:170-658(+)
MEAKAKVDAATVAQVEAAAAQAAMGFSGASATSTQPPPPTLQQQQKLGSAALAGDVCRYDQSDPRCDGGDKGGGGGFFWWFVLIGGGFCCCRYHQQGKFARGGGGGGWASRDPDEEGINLIGTCLPAGRRARNLVSDTMERRQQAGTRLAAHDGVADDDNML